MNPVSQSFSIYSGSSRSLLVTVTDVNGNPVNLTGVATLTWALIQNGATVLTKTLASGVTVTGAIAGQATVALAAADTTALVGQYTHECRMVDSAGHSDVIFTGTLTVTKAYV